MSFAKQCILGLVSLMTIAGVSLGDEPAPPAKHYKFEFVVQEVGPGGKVVNSRTYETMAAGPKGRGEIRTGSKIPFATTSTTNELINVGVNFDLLNIEELPNQKDISFQVTAEVTSVAEGSEPGKPTIRQNRWDSQVVVPLKARTLLFSSDNLDAKSKMQIEVTAIPISQ